MQGSVVLARMRSPALVLAPRHAGRAAWRTLCGLLVPLIVRMRASMALASCWRMGACTPAQPAPVPVSGAPPKVWPPINLCAPDSGCPKCSPLRRAGARLVTVRRVTCLRRRAACGPTAGCTTRRASRSWTCALPWRPPLRPRGAPPGSPAAPQGWPTAGHPAAVDQCLQGQGLGRTQTGLGPPPMEGVPRAARSARPQAGRGLGVGKARTAAAAGRRRSAGRSRPRLGLDRACSPSTQRGRRYGRGRGGRALRRSRCQSRAAGSAGLGGAARAPGWCRRGGRCSAGVS